MNEAQRQSYLKAMGLTPWVARVALPGAAPSPALDWPEEEQANAPASAGPVVDVAMPSREPESAPVDAPLAAAESSPAHAGTEHAPEASAADALAKAPSARSVTPAQEQAKGEAPAPAKAKVKGLTFTLEAHLGGTTWLLCAQEDSQAPGLGRFEAPLMANLLALFQGRPQRPRRFFCPLTEQPMPADEAAQALSAFVAGLSEQSGGERVLLCLPETVAQALFEQPRYQPFELGRLPALVISSLAEMLADPVQHKKASWQAMQAHGYDGV
ncbi:hypothetical protein [Alcanivorax sp.]|uniref:hypothetical protein n=1 Tax=Alcanivorax sp. TaxID=1872427 RepID=UPI000C41B921|nr:hypothetical protein [Alcanivorax sp.]MBQ23309.1 hypothetical protein [Alcanivorax sp.]